MSMLNWSLFCSLNVMFQSTMNSVQRYVHTAKQVPIQHFATNVESSDTAFRISCLIKIQGLSQRISFTKKLIQPFS